MKHGTLLHTVASLVRSAGAAFLLAWWPATAPALEQGTLVVSGDRQQLDLDRDARILEDRTGLLDADTLFDAPGKDWQRVRGGHFTAGYSDATWWVSLSLRNVDDVPRERVLSILEPSLDEVTMYARCDGQSPETQTNGDRMAWQQRALPDRNVSFVLALPADAACRVLLRVRSGEEISLPLVLQDAMSFTESRTRDSVVGGAVLGMLVLLMLIAVALYGVLRHGDLLRYVGLLAAQLLVSLALTGFGYAWLWPGFPTLQNTLPALAIALAWFATSRFCLRLVGERVEAGWPEHAVHATALLALVVALAITFQPGARLFTLLVLDVGIGVLVLLAYTVAAAMGGMRHAAGVSAGVVAVCVGALVEITRALGLHGLGDNDKMPLLTGFLLQSLLFGTALMGDPAHRLRDHRGRRELDREVKRRVAERTRELASTVAHLTTVNRELDRLNATDALTGVFSRRFLDTSLPRVAHEMCDQHAPLSLILFDIDHFKRVNDAFGHPAGDACLRQIAARVQRVLRNPPDTLCRYGGEEFAVILPCTDLDGAKQVAEKIRRAVAAAPIELPDGTALEITVSLGVACFHDNEDFERLVSVADHALYDAKRHGRNRWTAEAA